MSTEPLPQLLAAVEHELTRQREEYVRYGMDLDTAAAVDEQARTVVITGASLLNWGVRMRLTAILAAAGLQWEATGPDVRFVVFPASR